MSDDARADAPTVRELRERVIRQLSDAFSRDELELEEFERRLTVAHRTESPAELDALVTDLAAAATVTVPATALAKVEPPPAPLLPIRMEETALSIMGSVVRRGQWTPPRSMRAVSILGSVELDFREVTLPMGVTDLDIFTFMGSVEILVPPTLAVDMTGSAVMGSFEHAQRAPVRPDPERAILRVHGVSVMGSVTIVTRLPGESGFDAFWRRRRERRALRDGASKPPLLPSGKR